MANKHRAEIRDYDLDEPLELTRAGPPGMGWFRCHKWSLDELTKALYWFKTGIPHGWPCAAERYNKVHQARANLLGKTRVQRINQSR